MAKAVTGTGKPAARNTTQGVRVRGTGKWAKAVPAPQSIGARVSSVGTVRPWVPGTVEDLGTTADLFSLSAGTVGTGVVRTKLAVWDVGSNVHLVAQYARLTGAGSRAVANIKPVNILTAQAGVVNGGAQAPHIGTGSAAAAVTSILGNARRGSRGTGAATTTSAATVSGIQSTGASSEELDWQFRRSRPGVVWWHGFDSDTEVTQHYIGDAGAQANPVLPRRVLDSSGFGCVEQINLGATLAANFTAGSTTMILNDVTYWPDPAVTGSFYFMVCRQHPNVGNKNLFLCTARSGTTLTVSYYSMVGNSAFATTPQSYVIGDYAGNESIREWRRVFSALPAGDNGKSVDDPADGGLLPLRSRTGAGPHAVPRDSSYFQYGWYGHPTVQANWQNWTPWVGTTNYTTRGPVNGVAAKYGLWDGNEFYIQWSMKIDPRYWANHAQPDPPNEDTYWGRKTWAVQSEVSSLNQLVSNIAPSNKWGIPSTNPNPLTISTYKAARSVGVDDYPRARISHQLGGPWDVAPYFANLITSGRPSTGCPTPDGAAAWEYKDGEWVTYLLRVKPGRSGVNETEIELKVARPDDPSYAGTYTTIMNVSDVRIIYSGSSDWDQPDGVFSYPAVPIMDALPGYQAFGLMGYQNISQSVQLPPPKASYYIRMRQVIFSRQTIPAPAPASLSPAWYDTISDGSWGTIAATGNLFSVAPESTGLTQPFVTFSTGVSGSVGTITGAWCGASVDQTRGEYLLAANGGHADYAGNEVYALSLRRDTPAWRRLTDPTPNDQFIFNPDEGNGLWLDNRPRAMHNCFQKYANNRIWIGFQNSVSSGGGGNFNRVVSFRRDFQALLDADGTRATGGAGASLPWTSANIGPWDTSHGAVPSLSDQGAPFGRQVYNSRDKYMYCLGGKAGGGTAPYWRINTLTGGVSTYQTGTIPGFVGGRFQDWAFCIPEIGSAGVIVAADPQAQAVAILDCSKFGQGDAWVRFNNFSGAPYYSPFIGGDGGYPADANYLPAFRQVAIINPYFIGARIYKIQIPNVTTVAALLASTWTWSSFVPTGGTGIEVGGPKGSWGKGEYLEDVGNGRGVLVYVGSVTSPTFVYRIPPGGLP